MDASATRPTTPPSPEGEAIFRQTFERAPVGIAHVGLDGRWIRFNTRIAEIVGYTAEELQQLTFQDITFPPDLPPDLGQAERLLRGEIDQYTMEKRYVRKEGSLVWVNLGGSLVRDAAGVPQLFIAIVEEIQARKEAEARLRAAEERLRAMFATAATGFALTDLAGRFER